MQGIPLEQTVQITSSPSSPPIVDGPAYELQAKASTGLPVTFASLAPQNIGGDVCTVAGAEVTFHVKGECPLEARQVGNSKYRAATEMQRLHVLGITQTIAFMSVPPCPAVTGVSYEVNAVSSAGFHVQYESATPSVCVVESYGMYFSGNGTCTIVATARGNNEYEEGRAEQSFQVSKALQQISFQALTGRPLPLSCPNLGDGGRHAVPGASPSPTQALASWPQKTSKCPGHRAKLRGACRPRQLIFDTGTLTID